MTLNEKYIQELLPHFAAAVEGGEVRIKVFNGLQGWEFPCPFCATSMKRGSKKRSRCAAFIPHKQSFSYTFHCCRKQSTECSNSMSLPNFLKTYNPPLFKKYHLERESRGTTGKGHNISHYNYKLGEN